MNLIKMQEQLIKHEGLRLNPYRCTAGKLTIGVGRNLEGKGITGEEARYLLDNDIAECFKDLTVMFPDHFNIMPEALQMVLIDMRFQLGPAGFRNFRRMIVNIQRDNIKGMIREMKDSNWYKQTPNRASELVAMVEGFIE